MDFSRAFVTKKVTAAEIYDQLLTLHDYGENFYIAETMMALRTTDIVCTVEQMEALARRINNVLYAVDEPRFTIVDYSGAIGHSEHATHIPELLKMNDDDFNELAITLAEKDREHYE